HRNEALHMGLAAGEVAAGDDEVARFDPFDEVRVDRLEQMRDELLRIGDPLDGEAERHHALVERHAVAEDVTKTAPDERRHQCALPLATRITVRGSVTWPATADAATVSGLPRYASPPPKRPSWLVAAVEIETSPLASGPITPPAHGPHPGGS